MYTELHRTCFRIPIYSLLVSFMLNGSNMLNTNIFARDLLMQL